jgi:hypothetical protein
MNPQLTNQQLVQLKIKEEIKKCASDPVYFMKKYCYIQHPQRGKILFKLYPFQEDTLRQLIDNRFNIILKSRQLGISTLSAGISLWYCMYKTDFNILIIATKAEVAKNMVTKVKEMYDLLPDWFKNDSLGTTTVEYNKMSVRFKNGSQILAAACTADAGRSLSISLCVIDEAAFIQTNLIEDLWSAVFPTLSTGGRAIILSTPAGIGGWYHRQWIKAEEKETSFNTIKLHWTVHPERDQMWRDEQTKILGDSLSKQECDCLNYNTNVKIIDYFTKEIKQIKIGELYNSLSSTNEIKTNNRYQILTPNKYQLFSGIRKVNKDEYYNITLSNNKIIICSLEHPFIINKQIIKANELKINDNLDNISNNIISVIDIKYKKESIELYDIVNVDNGNLFIIENDIITHNCDFLSSGTNVISMEILKHYEENICKEPVELRGMKKQLSIWKYPDFSKKYMVVSDVSRGDGTDYSTFHVIEIENLEQVAEFRDKVGTTELASILVSISTEYNNALLVIENTGLGWAAVQQVINLNYNNLYYSYRDRMAIDPDSYTKKNYDLKANEDKVPGFTNSTKTRPLLVDSLIRHFEDKSPIIYSKRLINELTTFVWYNNKAQAQSGYNDDLVMAYSIMLWVRETVVKLREYGIDLSKNTLVNIHNAGAETIHMSRYKAHNPFKMKTPKGGEENLDWLLNK